MTKNLERFFSGCKNPLAVSELIATLKAKRTIIVERIPIEVLPCALMWAKIAKCELKKVIVDDYDVLFTRIREEFERPDGPRFWFPEQHLISSVCYGGVMGEYVLPDLPEAYYMIAAYRDVLVEEVN